MNNIRQSSLSANLQRDLQSAATALQKRDFKKVVKILLPWAQRNSDQPEVLQMLGVSLIHLGKLHDALKVQKRATEISPRDATVWINLAATQERIGDTDAALRSLERAAEIDDKQPALFFNRGNALLKRGQLSAALASFQRAEELIGPHPDLACNSAIALRDLGRLDEAQMMLETMLARHSNHALAWNLLGTVFHRQGEDSKALQAYAQAANLAPHLADAYGNAAQVLARLQRYDEAIACVRRALELKPGDAIFQRTLGIVLSLLDRREEAYALLENAHLLNPEDSIALSCLLGEDMITCRWDALDLHFAKLRTLWERGHAECLVPWRLLSLPLSGRELKEMTETNIRKQLPPPRTWMDTGHRLRREKSQKLRIGYFSADFYQHATMVLMAGLFEAHDKNRFEIFGFSFGKNVGKKNDAMRERVIASFDRFEVVDEMTSFDIAKTSRDMGVHIAVDMNGHTKNSRQNIFCHRAAPIQMHYLGYPGTLGMPGAIDYILADKVVVPPEAYDDFSEKIITLPDSYQVNDRRRIISEKLPSREELGLPENGFVFCCFNNNYKISRDLFALWMTLLQQRPGSVLWLLEDNPLAAANLRAAATAAGVDSQRLVFARRVALPDHLARHARADLFLDTFYYNAHTTASDALWAGLPVLTCQGATFASRVGASLLRACDLPELITSNPREYLELALTLSANPLRLQTLRKRLWDSRLSVPLFDTERFARHLELAFEMAWKRFEQGLPPEHFVVPPLDPATRSFEVVPS